MVAALSWAARLKNGLARTREVLNTPVSELFVRRRVDESLFQDLETALLQADCGVAATDWLLSALRDKARKERIEEGDVLKRALKDSVAELLRPLERRLDTSRAKPFIIMIAGVNGSGKTTSIGKLAKWLQSQGRSVLLAAGDTFRAAAREELLVLDAKTGQNALAQVKAFDEALGLSGLILTKLDGTAKGGVVCAIARERPVPLLFVGVGEDIDDLRPFVAHEFAEALVG